MIYRLLRRLHIASFLFFFANSAVYAQGGFLGSGGDTTNPSLTLAPVEIVLNVPTPVNGNNLDLLLARGSGNSLSALKEQATRKFTAQLRSEWYDRLREFFVDEEVPLVQRDGFLTLHSFLDISVSTQLTDLKSSGNFEVERGTLKLSGDFHYQLKNPAGATLQGQSFDIADLRVQEKYLVKTPNGGGEVEDTTDAAIERALAKVVRRLLDRIEDQLEADQLREMAAL